MASSEKKKKAKKIILIVLAVLLALILIFAGTFLILYKTGKSQFHSNDKNINVKDVNGDVDISIEDEDTVSYNGKNYTLDKNVVSLLFIGVDKKNLDDNLGYGKSGQADSIFVAAVNTKTKKIKIIPVQRETMVDVNRYSTTGSYTGTKNEQICLAYAYGNTPQSSSENVLTAVSRSLMGINISSYVAMDLDGISKMTEMIGGVTVNSLEDIKMPKIGTVKQGQTILLKGDNARHYVRLREQTLDGSLKRLQRQKQFLSAFASTAGNQIKNDFTKLKDYYDTMAPYYETNMSFSQITYLVSSTLTTNIGSGFEYKTIEGERKFGEKWIEFVPDNNSLIETILDTFYVKE